MKKRRCGRSAQGVGVLALQTRQMLRPRKEGMERLGGGTEPSCVRVQGKVRSNNRVISRGVPLSWTTAKVKKPALVREEEDQKGPPQPPKERDGRSKEALTGKTVAQDMSPPKKNRSHPPPPPHNNTNGLREKRDCGEGGGGGQEIPRREALEGGRKG